MGCLNTCICIGYTLGLLPTKQKLFPNNFIYTSGKRAGSVRVQCLIFEHKGYLPFTWENREFQLENQMVRAIPFGKIQKIWAVI